jgi:hypothetical protein
METWIEVSTGILMKGTGFAASVVVRVFIGDVGTSSAPLFNDK